MMKNLDFQRIDELFNLARRLPPEEQAALLDAECADAPDIRREVEVLLQHDRKPHELFDATLPIIDRGQISNIAKDARRPDAAPDAIGPYRILHEIGRGGMGVVYLGEREDGKFARRVAIKLLKRGMDTEDLLRRFELERQLLSAMEHPGIARLYDAGETDDGLPFFVMEHVDGLPVDQYCDVHRLKIDERLHLFQHVCEAVHHAHQNLVVHRDLKPSNIIITKDGQPKLLDFGIAKLVNPGLVGRQDVPTAPELRVMTPEYASPEQVRGNPISTASDIYSLGVLLYELVSGHRPYRLRDGSRWELQRIICEEDPERPSTAISRVEETHPDDETLRTPAPRMSGLESDTGTATLTPESVSRTREGRPERLRRRLQGDIDNIVLMAMRKEPQRRYASAEQFAADIQRHLEGLPVKARPDTITYRVQKFVHRHRGGVAAAALFVLVLILGIVGTTWGWRVAARERDRAVAAELQARQQQEIADTQRARAERRFDEVRALAHTFMFDFHDAIQELDGAVPARELLVTTAEQYLDGLGEDAGDDVELQRELASAYERVGDIRGGLRNPSLGGAENALESYRRAHEIRRALAEADPDDEAVQADLAASHEAIGDMLLRLGDVTAAHESYLESLAIRESMLRDEPDDPDHRRLAAVALLNAGASSLALGDRDAAREYYDRSLEIREALAAEQPDDDRVQRELSVAYLRVGGRFEAEGDHAEALRKYEDAVRIRRTLSDADPASGRKRRDLAVARYFAGRACLALDRHDDALAHLRFYLETMEQRRALNPDDARTVRDLALAYEIVGTAQAAAGDLASATENFRRFQSLMLGLAEASPSDTQYRMLLAVSHERLGESAAADGDFATAIERSRDAVSILEALVEKDPDDRRLAEDLARNLSLLGGWLDDAGSRAEALRTLENARAGYRALWEDDGRTVSIRDGYLETTRRLLASLLAIEDTRAALRVARESLEIEGERPPALLREMARAFAAEGDTAQAIQLADEALQALRDAQQAGDDVDTVLIEHLRRELEEYRARSRR